MTDHGDGGPPQHWLRALIRTAGARLIALPVTALLSILAASITVRYAGDGTFGYVSLLSQLTMLLPFADLGLGAAVTRSVARRSLHPAWTIALIKRTMRILAGVGVGGVLISIGVGILGGWSGIIGGPAGAMGLTDLTTSAILATFFLLLPLAVGQRVLVGQDRAVLVVILGVVPPVCNLLFTAAMVAAGAPALLIALGTSVGSVVTVSLFAAAAFVPRLGGLRLRDADATKHATTGTILRSGLPMLLTSLGTATALQSGRLTLAWAGTPEQLSQYALAFQLYLPLYSVLYMASTVLWPRFSVKLDRPLWIRANGALGVLGLLAAAGYLIVGPVLADLMSDGLVTMPPLLASSMACLLIVQGLNATQQMLLTDEAGLKFQARCAIVGSFLTVTLSLLFAGSLGAAAPAVGAALGLFVSVTIPGLLRASRLVQGV